jgi:GTP cyclohydrolase I
MRLIDEKNQPEIQEKIAEIKERLLERMKLDPDREAIAESAARVMVEYEETFRKLADS